MVLDDGGLPEAMSDKDAAGGRTEVKRRPGPSEDGVLVKREVPWLKLQATIKKVSGSATEMDRTGK